jgi:hypothetical protein
MGWARGFQVGSEAGRAMIDTYRQARQQRELRDIRQAKPEESMGYTAEQGRELEAIAGAINPETGQPYYNVEAIPGTAQFRVTPNFQVAGEQGQMQQAMPVDMAPQRVTDYLGQRYAGDLAPEQQERAQYRAMADVYAQTNPMEAARLRMSLSQDERAAKEFEQSTELRGLQIGSAQRQAKITSKIDNIIEEEEKNIATARTVFTNNGLEGGAAELKKRGLPVQFKNGAIEVLDEKGKVVERITDVNQALARVEEVIQNDMASRLASVSGDPALIRQAVQDRLANQIKQRELNIRERESESSGKLRTAQTALIYKQIGQIDEKSAARDAAKPFVDQFMALSPEDQSGPKGYELLSKAAVAAATKSGDFATASKSTTYGSALQSYTKATEAAAKEGQPPPNFTQFMAGQGFAPDAVTKGQQKKVNELVAAGKRTEAQQLVNQHNATFFRTPISAPEGSAALPIPSQGQAGAPTGRRTSQRPGQGIVLESPFVRESVGGRSAQAQRRRAIED